jgi:hypothetical protein
MAARSSPYMIGWLDGCLRAGMAPELVDDPRYRRGYGRGKLAREAEEQSYMEAPVERKDIADIAETYSFVCACPTGGTSDKFEMLLEPYRPFGGWDWQKMSLCGVVAEAWMDRAGWDVPWHDRMYETGTAISRAIEWARRSKCWQPYDPSLTPSRGDVLVLMQPTHECVVLSCDGEVLETMDGGQLCTAHMPVAYQAIRKVVRRWKEIRRPVLGWIVADLAPRRSTDA